MLGVPDVRKAVDYFCAMLGFECGPNGGDEGAVYGIVRRGGVAIHLQIRRRPLIEARQSHEGDAYVFVDDVEALYAEYQRKGVKIHRALQDEEYGLRDFTIETPEGLRVAFGTPLARGG